MDAGVQHFDIQTYL